MARGDGGSSPDPRRKRWQFGRNPRSTHSQASVMHAERALADLPSPSRHRGGHEEDELSTEESLSPSRPSYRDQLRASGEQALQRVKNCSMPPKAAAQQSHSSPVASPVKAQHPSSPLTAPPYAPPEAQHPSSPLSASPYAPPAPGSPMSPLPRSVVRGTMSPQSSQGGESSPSRHSTLNPSQAPFLPLCTSPPMQTSTPEVVPWSHPAGPTWWSQSPAGSPTAALAATSPTGFGPALFEPPPPPPPLRSPEVRRTDDLMAIAMPQAMDFALDTEQITAQLKAAAPCCYED